MNKDVLDKLCFNYKDVMEIVGCKTTKAYSIMKVCRRVYNGTIKYEPSLITAESLFAYLGTSRQKLIGGNTYIYGKELYKS